MSRKLVVYFTAEGGKTRKLAESVASAAHADLRELVPTEPYTADDLYWPNFKCRSVMEMKTPGFFQEMKPLDVSVSDYDVIFVGFPVWCGTAPTIVRTFLRTFDFTGKTIVPFCTSGGGSAPGADADFKTFAPDAHLIPNTLLNRASVSRISEWISGLNLD